VDEFTWDGSAYATTNYTYNVRDQLEQINQAGQIRTFDYDVMGGCGIVIPPSAVEGD
jgi:hypothetical protein